MKLLNGLLERTELVKGLREEIAVQGRVMERDAELRRALREIGVWWTWDGSLLAGFQQATAHLPEPQTAEHPAFPYCVRCNSKLHKGERYSVLTVIHDECGLDNHCDVVAASLPVGEKQ